MKYMYAAYAITWVIHIVYLYVLTRGYKRVAEEEQELERK
jgi:hypothetical protein